MLTDLDYELLSAYIDDALIDTERTAFELRLQAEPELSRELDELRATVTLLNNLPPHKAPRDFTLDARYARRSSFFFTSATFSALSTAAAIILFALGTYLFTGTKTLPPAASFGQVAQSAFQPSLTAVSLDKSGATTATELDGRGEFQSTTPSLASGYIASSGLAQENTTVEPPKTADLKPLLQTGSAQSTQLPNDGIVSSSGSVAPALSDEQGLTSEATEASINQLQYAVPSTDNSAGAAVAPPPLNETQPDANTSPVFAATQLPSLIATAAPTSTLLPTATRVPTTTHTPQPKATATSLPTAPPPPTVPLAASTSVDSFPLLLIGLGIALLIVAIGTTIIRRRNRS